MFAVIGFLFSPVFFFVIFLLVTGLRVINQYERGVILTLGKYSSTRKPGLTWVFPVVQRMIKVDLRISTTDVPKQEVITKDNVPVGINAVVYYRVENPEHAILNIQNFVLAVSLYAQAALRDVIGGVELDSLLTERENISKSIKKIVDEATKVWGIDITDIKMQDIELPQDMKRVMAKQAESERERRAVIIKSEGEASAAAKLASAAQTLAGVPGGLTLRTLSTIEKTSVDPAKTIVYVIPMEFMDALKSLSKK